MDSNLPPISRVAPGKSGNRKHTSQYLLAPRSGVLIRIWEVISDLESLAMVNELAGCGQTTQLWSNVN